MSEVSTDPELAKPRANPRQKVSFILNVPQLAALVAAVVGVITWTDTRVEAAVDSRAEVAEEKLSSTVTRLEESLTRLERVVDRIEERQWKGETGSGGEKVAPVPLPFPRPSGSEMEDPADP